VSTADRRGGLDALRLGAALLVFLSHATITSGVTPGDHLTALGPLGVSVFFVLSGYLIPKAWTSQPRGYVIRRLARVVPAYLVAVLGLAMVTGHVVTVADLTMTQPIDPDHLFLAVAWTLRVEIAFYALVPFLGLLPTWGIVALGIVSFAGYEAVPDRGWLFDPRYHLWRFVPGMLLARYAVPRLPLAGVGLGVVVAAWAVVTWMPVELGAVAATILVAVAVSRPIAVPRWVVFGATISYGIYLWHAPLLGVLPLLPAIATTITAATASYYLVERPFMAAASGRAPAPAPRRRASGTATA
jgi:peptidoglycan/LPS O-acetylase OafA/YrhL